ncbi:tyrosine-type recombinase/integrase [Marininema halotolerans]|uniref:Integrase/recombinase XerD n=1 Tax=Marininema halotolerans TaxID=1155944 RepID=A0A1I6Q544_9BACL|nr:tyrosine-type recombinase/integrase [Marininema halotolerans]SFS47445.1 integrase/recombinase XerD [Marininema halotolerans]
MSRKRRVNTIHVGEDTQGGTILSLEAEEFEIALKTFIRNCRIKNLTEESIKYYRQAINKFAQVCGKSRPVDITQEDVENAILNMRSKKLSDSALNSYIRGWRPFFRYLHEQAFIPENPTANIKLLKAEKKVIQAFSKEQMKHLLSIPDKETFTGYRNFCMMELLFDTGIRVSELASIKLTDINWPERSITVFGKGRKERNVPFQLTVERHLKEYVKIRGRLDHDFLFINIDNNPIAVRSVQDEIKKVGDISGIKGVRVSPHTFRHTFAKFYILNGGDAFSLQQILGHTSLDVVRLYVSLFGTDIAGQHRKFSPLDRLND